MQERAQQITAFVVFAIIIAGYAVMAVYYPAAYIWATYEDLYGEWTQTYLFLAGFLIALRLAFTSFPYRWFFALLALALCYVVLEEISWGQRLIGFETPEFFRRHNLQREANLHNLVVGPVSTLTKDLIEYTLAAALCGYGLLYPWMLRLGWSPARRLDAWGCAAPPLYLAPFFVTAAVLELGWLSFNEAEIAEVLVGFALAAMGLHYWALVRRQARPSANHLQSALPQLGLFVGAILLAVVTTQTIYANPQRKAAIDARLLNGYEKFARRYDRYGRWQTAVDLYQVVHRHEPQRTSILRKLAKGYRKLGDEERFWFYNQQALDVTLKVYALKPSKISTNLSLVRSYRQRGDEARAQQHLRSAHATAQERVQRRPQGAKEAYWLAKTYREMGDYRRSLEEFRRAFELKPGSVKYRKAYYRMRAKVNG